MMLPLPGRLLVRVVPLWGESLRGYLMRAAEANGLSGADRLLTNVVGGAKYPTTTKRAVALADYCRCDVFEFMQLFGIERRTLDGLRQWQFAGEVVTKDYFLRPSQPSVCPRCLVESAYLRGQWEMTFFVACPFHNIWLIQCCPGCGKALSPHRAQLDQCNCGFAFAEACPEVAPPEAVWAAQLIQRFISDGAAYVAEPQVTTHATTDRLATLGLDALFKTFWFIGQYLGEEEFVPVGRARPGAGEVVEIFRKTIEVLDGWPGTFLQRLEERMQGFDPERTRRPEKALMPLRNYLEQELNDDGHVFIHAAYDRFVRDAWRNRAYDTYRKNRMPQMELF
jgi:hypothetical protein